MLKFPNIVTSATYERVKKIDIIKDVRFIFHERGSKKNILVPERNEPMTVRLPVRCSTIELQRTRWRDWPYTRFKRVSNVESIRGGERERKMVDVEVGPL